MSELLSEGQKLMIAHRRLFPSDDARFFVGAVVAYSAGVVKVRGRTFVRDMSSGRINPKKDERTKIVSLASGTMLVYQLPDSVDLESFAFRVNENRVSAVDGSGLEMNLDEHPSH